MAPLIGILGVLAIGGWIVTDDGHRLTQEIEALRVTAN
jgi:hypothetical protein